MYKTSFLALIIALFSVVISGCSDKNPAEDSRVYSFSGLTMGTSYHIKVVAADGADDDMQKLHDKVQAVLDRVNGKMSTYLPDSELSRFNQSTPGDWFPVSAETAKVVGLSEEISKLSGGAFDITVGPLVNLWGFGPDPSQFKAPPEEKVKALMQEVGYQHIQVRQDPPALKKDHKAYIDLSAVAKGYAVDAVAETIGKDYPNYLVEVGGELRAHGKKPNNTPWRVAVESPVADARDIQRVIEVANVGIATSGDYRNFFEQNGVRYSHTINPVTGKPIRHRLASATVLDPSCARADALATSMMVLGEKKGLEWATKLKIPVFLVYKEEDGGFAEAYTPEFEPYLKQR